MCGIAGLISSRPVSTEDVAPLRRINGALLHRGPNSEGFFRAESMAMAMRRLSIVDLEGGHQPLYNEDRSLAIVCNGEIYNHVDLRASLQQRGHTFSSHSDVETILHLYEEKGESCVDELCGMYAFALWDSRKRKVLLGRDRLGEKPLYMWRSRAAGGGGQLWWASELSALMHAIPRGQRQLSPSALYEFLALQYVVEPTAPVEGVVQLAAGHTLLLSPDDLDAQPRRYWSMLQVAAAEPDNPVERVTEWLDTACRRMGSADVPVGVALSGGIDSSLVAAITARHYPGQIHGFTVGYTGRPATDERAIANRFAQSLGIPFTEIEIDPRDMVEEFPQLVRAMDTPVGDIAAFGYYEVCRAARAAGIPVLLSGMGGDEFFWGYEWVREAARAATSRIGGKSGLFDRLLRTAHTGAETSILAPHRAIADAATLARSLIARRDEIAADHWLEVTRPVAGEPGGIAVSETLSRTWLLCNCLSLVDRMSMAHSIEMRVPFLDIELVNGVTGMRRGGLDDFKKPHKWLLLSAYGHLLPAEIKHRKKQGFTPPVQDWQRRLVERWGEVWRSGSSLADAGIVDRAMLEMYADALPLEMQYRLTIAEIWASAMREVPAATDLIPDVVD